MRFAADCVQAGIAADDRLLLAVSGGADSLALLVLARRAMTNRIAVASVDHGLRAEAAAETAMVADACRRMAVPHHCLSVTVPTGGNLQAAARTARYAALARCARSAAIDTIVTAHHADDQAETMLMRMGRGAGTRGLAGMRAKAAVPGSPDLRLSRPLLTWRRSELAAVVSHAGLLPVHDPSNADLRFLRVRVRSWLADAPDGIDAGRLARSAAILAQDDDALDWAAQREWDAQVTIAGHRATYTPLAPMAIRLRVVRRLLLLLRTQGDPRDDEITRLLLMLEAGKTATLAGLSCRAEDSAWQFAPAPPRRTG
ncbi:tRNA lysidine(34) synthetase TilS [Croceicoccus sp. F390]|uniref:tRNA(Ile)-lysidine synthase n=1 Tax=Croceicoccus esteveae TaxID=3075597 RepID=A0ABU2ZHP6_9SPHN|nr:tRNA lysidine(34) synthetase TilS [Croceicoccus sp. F390]MDT0576133.1 tRNA lysidine(34) synthetase TilS [Croceicoccus sp. F390]